MQLHQFVPHTRVHLAANISMALSKIYKQKFDVSIPQWRVLAPLTDKIRYHSCVQGKITLHVHYFTRYTVTSGLLHQAGITFILVYNQLIEDIPLA
jgi:hypothetical protein